jgi:hypothetical protein
MLAEPQCAREILEGATPGTGGSGADGRFAAEALRVHGLTNALITRDHRLQFPWPKALGTQPWAAARFLNELGFGARYRVLFVDPARPDDLFNRIKTSSAAGIPNMLFVGDVLCPRHIVLSVQRRSSSGEPDAITIYDPASGGLVDVTRASFSNRRLAIAGWDEPWLVVTAPSAAH